MTGQRESGVPRVNSFGDALATEVTYVFARWLDAGQHPVHLDRVREFKHHLVKRAINAYVRETGVI